jgi:hypothetical protein
MHGYLLTGLCALQLPKKVVLSMARFRLSGNNLRIETGRHEGLLRNEMSCCRCKRLLSTLHKRLLQTLQCKVRIL